MIAYDVLVQTIADWKSGARPTAPMPAAAPEAVEELASGVVDLDDEEDAGQYYADESSPDAEYASGDQPEYQAEGEHQAEGEYQAEGDAEQGGYEQGGYEQAEVEQAGDEQAGYAQTEYEQAPANDDDDDDDDD